ncbi:MerR family transcriptional regulator [Nocardiopsis suaedae]|uniref:MerR family transcriptional regulator n=1 Tax=Nocardiopsis suaedae TaxID=3018444 RepID=A0ABT4TF13_9ACTN|nr:MerR family transcriptional regulator [Nocardiopsis suaedae]MDA2802941.1 MerR family transcriptional regulator [Nocardiopsis suaedae]
MPPRSTAFRPTDLAGEHGLSAQAVRNYEEQGILPPAERGANGYRRYGAVHAQALRAFLALRRGFGHRTATEVLNAANRGEDEAMFRIIDRAHAALLHERETLDEVEDALEALLASPPEPSPHAPRGRAVAASAEPLTVGALAHQVGLHPATLRTWERVGILRPERDRATGYRVYSPEAARDAHAARELRRGGFPLTRIRDFLDRLRGAGDPSYLGATLDEWRAGINARSRAMLAGARELEAYLATAAGAGAFSAANRAR